MKVSNEFKTGVIAVVAIAAFIWGYSYLKGENLFDDARHFYAEYDNVQGLESSGSVTINGLKVGKIDQVFFHPKKIGRIVVRFSLDNPYQFSKKSVARIYSPDFISGKAIKILPVYDGDMAKSGDTLRGNVEIGILGSINDQIAPLQKKVESFVISADTLLNGLNQVLDKDGRANLNQSFAKLNTMLSSFNNSSRSLERLLAKDGKLDSVLGNASIASANLAKISDSLNQANLKLTIRKLESTINNFNKVMSALDNGEGTMGKLLKDEGLYNNLEGATKEMEELLREMKLNPKRFVHFSLFGKKPKPYTASKDSVN